MTEASVCEKLAIGFYTEANQLRVDTATKALPLESPKQEIIYLH